MKKIILLSILTLCLTGCFPLSTKPAEKQVSIISSEVVPVITKNKKAIKKTVLEKTIKTTAEISVNTNTNQSAEEMTKELDSLIDGLISGK